MQQATGMRGPLGQWVAIGALLVSSTLCCIPADSAQPVMYDAAADFSTNSNPNGVWSYGDEPPYEFTLYRVNAVTNNLEYWGYILSQFIGMAQNPTDTIITNGPAIWQPGQLGIIPHFGGDDDIQVLRWTAPTAGLYEIAASFAGMDTNLTTTAVQVLYNLTNSILSAEVSDGYGPTSAVSVVVTQVIAAADIVDFTVVDNSNTFAPHGIETSLAATITLIPPGTSDVAVTTSVFPNPPISESNVVYTITVTNAGPDAAAQLFVTNTLPPEVWPIGYNVPGAVSLTNTGPKTLTAFFWSLDAGASQTLSITGHVDCITPDGAQLTNIATAVSRWFDPDTNNNQLVSVITNSNPSGAACTSSLHLREVLKDKVSCDSEDCFANPSGSFAITIRMPLSDVGTAQFNSSTALNLNIGDSFSLSHVLGDDPHYTTRKTRATFVDKVNNYNSDSDKMLKYITTTIQWTKGVLTLTMKGTTSTATDRPAVLANQYYESPTAIINDTTTASIEFGGKTVVFDVVNISGAVVTVEVTGRGDTFAVSGVELTASGGG